MGDPIDLDFGIGVIRQEGEEIRCTKLDADDLSRAFACEGMRAACGDFYCQNFQAVLEKRAAVYELTMEKAHAMGANPRAGYWPHGFAILSRHEKELRVNAATGYMLYTASCLRLLRKLADAEGCETITCRSPDPRKAAVLRRLGFAGEGEELTYGL